MMSTDVTTLLNEFDAERDKDKKKELIKCILLSDETTPEQYTDIFGDVWKMACINFEELQKVISFLAENEKLLLLREKAVEAVEFYLPDGRECVYEYAFSLIIDVNGYKRILGRDLWDSLNMGSCRLNTLFYGTQSYFCLIFATLKI